MIDESIFATEIRIPEEVENMLKVSIKHDKLRDLMQFIMQVLQRHEKALKGFSEKFKAKEYEISKIWEELKGIEKDKKDQESKLDEALELFSRFEEELMKRFDSSESINFILELGTKQASLLGVQQREIDEIKTLNEKLLKSLNDLEKKNQVLAELVEKISLKKCEKIPKKEKKKLESIEEAAKENDRENLGRKKEISETSSKDFEEKKVRVEKLIHLSVIQEIKTPAPEKHSSENKKKKLEKEENPTRNPIIKSLNKAKQYEGVFPYLNKTFTETEKNLTSSTENLTDSKSQTKSQFVLPSKIKQIEKRLEIIERLLAESEHTSVLNKLKNMEKSFNFYSSQLDKFEPDISKNASTIRRVSEKVLKIERDLFHKTNVEHFDPVKNLVMAIASGSVRKNMPKPETSSSLDQNILESLLKRVSVLEDVCAVSKITSINFEELSYKLLRLEQKLDLKLDSSELDIILESLQNLSNKIQSLTPAEDTQSSLTKQDLSHISSLSRKILQIESQLSQCSFPTGLSFQSFQDEIKHIWESIKLLLSSVDSYTSQFNSKLSDLALTGFAPNIEKIKKTVENDIRAEMKELADRSDKKYADKFEMLRGFKYVEAVLKRVENNKKSDLEEVILAKKPLNGWACGSCEKGLEKLSGRVAGHTTWNKLPVRDPKDRIIKAGSGYGNMIIQLDPIGRKREDGLALTERSITPTPFY